jgi:hypothetical protein
MAAKKSANICTAPSPSACLFGILEHRAVCMSRRECNDGMPADCRTKRNAMFPMPGGFVCDGVPDSLLPCRRPAKEPGVVGRGERERWRCRYAGVLCGETRPERATGTLAGCSVHVQCQGPARRLGGCEQRKLMRGGRMPPPMCKQF